MLKIVKVKALGGPPERDQRSVGTWIRYASPLVQEQKDFILNLDDLITAKHKVTNGPQPNRMEDILDAMSARWPDSWLEVRRPPMMPLHKPIR